MDRRSLMATAFLIAAVTAALSSHAEMPTTAPAKATHKSVAEIFNAKPPLMLQCDFSSATDPFKSWVLNLDDHYDLATADPERINVVDAPGLANTKAVRFYVKRAPNSFRSEITLPSENKWSERWYAERILLSKGWITDPAKGRTIVMQWHAIPGKFRPTFPNLDIAVQHDRWIITRSFGDPTTKPTRDNVVLDEPIRPGEWTSWVIHAKWSPNADGLLQIWKEGRPVLERIGPNVYGTIGVAYTPYLQTGIYHPSWHLTNDAQRREYQLEENSKTPVTSKIVYIADVKVGDEHATFADVAPSGQKIEQ